MPAAATRPARGKAATLLNDDVQERVLAVVRNGQPNTDAAAAAGISYTTFKEWLQRGQDPEHPRNKGQSDEQLQIYRDFAAAVADARLRFKVEAAGGIRKAGLGIKNRETRTTTRVRHIVLDGKIHEVTDTDTVVVEREVAHWQALAWLLERGDPETWGRVTYHRLASMDDDEQFVPESMPEGEAALAAVAVLDEHRRKLAEHRKEENRARRGAR